MEFMKIPFYGFKVDLNHTYPEKRSQNAKPKWHQLWSILPVIIRYLFYYWKLYRKGRKPIMDFVFTENGKQIYGVPIGGLGSGYIGRGYHGEFCRFQLKPGIYEYNTVYAENAKKKTIFQSLLSTYEAPKTVLQSWKSLIDGSKCYYVELYPRAWTEYNLSEYGINLLCHQISSVIPKNYKVM